MAQRSKIRGHPYNLKIERMHPSSLKPLKLLRAVGPLPKIVDLRSKFPPVYDQGELGSCTANALCGVFEYNMLKQKEPYNQTSRLFVYYNERMIENSISDDAGAALSDGVKSLKLYGVCFESSWPYNIAKFTVRPPGKSYIEAKDHQALDASNIMNDMTSMKNALAHGYPFVVGISIYESFESDQVAKTGVVPMPNEETEKLLGGHAVVCVGYDDNRKMWIMRNSWGDQWGSHGYFYLPYQYLLDSDLSTDLWYISKIE